MSQKPIEVILTRQLASTLAMPVFLVDPDGTLLFYNEPAERLLGMRFDETGEMSAGEWSSLWVPSEDDGRPLAPERSCTMRSTASLSIRRTSGGATARWSIHSRSPASRAPSTS